MRQLTHETLHCAMCDKDGLSKEEIGICKKLLGKNCRNFYCLACLAEYLECDKDELLAKIEQFKSEGCKLFQ